MLSFSRFGTRQIAKHARFLSLASEHSVNSNAPLLEKARNVWPDPEHQIIGVPQNIPPRTVPDSALQWKMRASFINASVIVYPHLQVNPADAKVILLVKMADLNLTAEEQQIFLQMVGPRYNAERKQLKLTANKFQNRIENKKYLTLLLEQLLAEAKELNKQRGNFE